MMSYNMKLGNFFDLLTDEQHSINSFLTDVTVFPESESSTVHSYHSTEASE